MNTNAWSRYTGGRERLPAFGFPASFSGFFFGVLAYLFLGLALGYGQLGAVAVGALSGLVFGLAVGLVVWLAVRLSGGRTFFWLAAGLLVGAAAGGLIALAAVRYPNQAAWTELPPPPEPAVAVVPEARLGPYGGELYVETASGQMYGYACYNWLACDWRPVAEVPAFPQYANLEGDCPPGEPAAESVPEAADSFNFVYCGQGYAALYQVVLLEDGHLLARREFQPALGAGVLVPAFAVIGGFFGLASPWIMARNRRKPAAGSM